MKATATTGDLLIRPVEESTRRIALDFLNQAKAAAVRLADPPDPPDPMDSPDPDAADEASDASDPEALHDFRVALRRLRSTLRAYPDQLEAPLGRKLRRRLRRVVRRTGDGRDAEVGIGWLERFGPEIPPRARFATARLAADLEVERAAGYELARRAASGFRDLATDLERRLGSYRMQVDLASATAFEPFGVVAARAIGDGIESLGSALAQVLPDQDESAHQARIAGKRLRYLLEPLRANDPAVDALLDRLRDLQDLLGELQDLRVLADRIAISMVDAAVQRQREIVATALAADSGAAESLRSAVRRANPAAPLLGVLAPLAARRAKLRARLEGDWLEGRAETLLADCDRWLVRLRPAGQGAGS